MVSEGRLNGLGLELKTYNLLFRNLKILIFNGGSKPRETIQSTSLNKTNQPNQKVDLISFICWFREC